MVMSVRLPRDLERAVPRKGRSAWVIEAVRQRLRQERIEKIAQSAAAHAEEDLELLSEWEVAIAPVPRSARRKARR